MKCDTTHTETPYPIHVWLTAAQVAKRYSVSVPTVWAWARDDEKQFPKPHKLGENTTRWRLCELDAYDDEQAERGTWKPKQLPRRRDG